MLLSRLVRSCIDLVLPSGCAVCAVRMPPESHGGLCGECAGRIRCLSPPFCRICGMEVYSAEREKGVHPLCGECLKDPPAYTMARSVVWYDEQVQKLVHKLKYGRDLTVIPGFAELIGSFGMADFAEIDCVVVVPLHLRRLRRRGLNQAAVLARLFYADRLPIVQVDWLIRARNTVPQTKLGKAARKGNLSGAFQARQTSDFSGARVCLVDDVFTTGTTVKECSKVIMENGAKEVKVLTLARVKIPQSGR